LRLFAGHSLTARDISFVNGAKKSEGRVQITRNRINGTICSQGWDMIDANVLCRMKDFVGAISASKTFGQGSGPVWFTDMRCSGKEDNIEHCKPEKTTKCNHNRDAGVVCYTKEGTHTFQVACMEHFSEVTLFLSA